MKRTPSQITKGKRQEANTSAVAVSERLHARFIFCQVCKHSMAPRARHKSTSLVCVNKNCIGQNAGVEKELRTSSDFHNLTLYKQSTTSITADQQINNSSTASDELKICETDMTIPIIQIKCPSISCTSELCYRHSRAEISDSTYKIKYVCRECGHSFVS